MFATLICKTTNSNSYLTIFFIKFKKYIHLYVFEKAVQKYFYLGGTFEVQLYINGFMIK